MTPSNPVFAMFDELQLDQAEPSQRKHLLRALHEYAVATGKEHLAAETSKRLQETPFEEQLGGVLQGLVAQAHNAQEELAQKLERLFDVKLAQDALARDRPDHFHLAATAPLDGAVAGYLRRSLSSERAVFLYAQASFVEAHVEALIKHYEGTACCADKSRTVLRALARYLRTGQRIEFDYGGQYTYHLPRMVFSSASRFTLSVPMTTLL